MYKPFQEYTDKHGSQVWHYGIIGHVVVTVEEEPEDETVTIYSQCYDGNGDLDGDVSTSFGLPADPDKKERRINRTVNKLSRGIAHAQEAVDLFDALAEANTHIH